MVLNTLETKLLTLEPYMLHRKHYENDLRYCETCFHKQIPYCQELFNGIEALEDFSLRQLLALVPEKWCKRQNQLLKLRNSKYQLIAKYYPLTEIKPQTTELKNRVLSKIENLQGLQYVPVTTLEQFIYTLQVYHPNLTPVTIWLYMLANVELVIVQLLYELHFPVPFVYTSCGFTLFQANEGEDLNQFFTADFQLKAMIAQQLLQGAIQFSYGFNNYRLYITDLTADNVVYNKQLNKLSFIDLDTILIVDSTQASYKSTLHKYEYIECKGCFAYSIEDIAAYNISDLNIFSACQFLREDLYKDITKGFLYPLPLSIMKSYPSLKLLIDQCVDCPSNLCQHRFIVAEQLIAVLKQINQFYKAKQKENH